MWISRGHYNTLNTLIESAQERNTEMLRRDGERIRMEIELAQLRNDVDWFKMRINQLERERAALLRSVTGTKIEVPEFLPTYNPSEALDPNDNPFIGVGEDDLTDTPTAGAAPTTETMPRRTRN